MAQDTGKVIYLNLGAGNKFINEPGWRNYDLNPIKEGIYPLDLERDLIPHDDRSIKRAIAIDVLEHIRNLSHMLNEVHRVLEREGEFYVEVPHFPHDSSIADPTHVRYFIPETFSYFSEYEKAAEMYGFHTWSIKTLKATEERILCTMNPKK